MDPLKSRLYLGHSSTADLHLKAHVATKAAKLLTIPVTAVKGAWTSVPHSGHGITRITWSSMVIESTISIECSRLPTG